MNFAEQNAAHTGKYRKKENRRDKEKEEKSLRTSGLRPPKSHNYLKEVTPGGNQKIS